MLVATNTVVYDAAGKKVGTQIAEMVAYTAEELKPFQCSECGGPNNFHRDYWVKTGQNYFGSVEGYYKMCSRKEKQ